MTIFTVHIQQQHYLLNVWMWAGVCRRRHWARSIELTDITTPLTVIAHAVPCLTETEARTAVTCHGIAPIDRHCQQQHIDVDVSFGYSTVTNEHKQRIISHTVC